MKKNNKQDIRRKAQKTEKKNQEERKVDDFNV